MTERNKVEAGDVIELTLRFQVHSIDHLVAGDGGPAFTNLTYAHGEPRPNGKPNVFTFEVPDEFGRITILSEGVTS